MKVYLNITFIIFIIVINFILPNTTFAVEPGIQIPSSNELTQLSTTPFQYQWIKYQYVWGSDQPIDSWVQNAKQAGFKVLVSVAKKPANVPTGESGYQQFGNFMQNLAARLGNNVDAYEVWNEPNLNAEWTVWGTIDPKEYIKLLQAGAAGIKAGNPNAQVITAALAPLSADYDDEKFFNEFVAAGGLNIPKVDGIGWHSNVTTNIPPSNPSLQGFQRVKIALNKPKPVWITEFGWDRTAANISLATQLQYIQEAFKVGDELGGIQTMIIWNFGFGKLNPEFAPWDIGVESSVKSQESRDDKDSGCAGLAPEECALKLTNIATTPENISKNIKTTKQEPQDELKKIINNFLSFLGFNVNSPETFSTRSDVQVKTAIPESAQSKVQDTAQRTGENLGYNPDKINKDSNVQGTNTDQGVGIYQFMIPKAVQNSFAQGQSKGFACAYENSQYPTGIRPINGDGTQVKCNEALGIK